MAKYSFEFKKKVVLAYLNGKGGYKYLYLAVIEHQAQQLFFGW